MNRGRIPEVIQSSGMDCGPAALAALLGGFGLPVSYPRLREACQTDVDGTSIDTLEALAVRFGLPAEQVILPSDCLFLESDPALPCIAVVVLPNGLTHFIVVWQQRMGYVQIMDPARGRSWMRKDRFLKMLYEHQLSVEAADWYEYALTDEFKGMLTERLLGAGVSDPRAAELLAGACDAGNWQALANLDAALRLCAEVRGDSAPGSDQVKLLEALLATPALIPDRYYQVRPDPEDPDGVLLRGAVLVKVAGEPEPADPEDEVVARATGGERASVGSRLLGLVREIGATRLAVGLAATSGLIGLITFIEALVFRYLIGAQLPTDLSTLAIIAIVVVTPLFAAVLLEGGGLGMSQALGRALDVTLRTRLLRKLPRMGDGYFSSRLISDLAERGHAISQTRDIPDLARKVMILVSRIALLLLGLCWLHWALWPLVLLAGLVSLAAPLLVYPSLAERDLRLRTHLGALSRFHLDSLRGTEPIWAHGAAEIIEREQESLLQKWLHAVRELHRPGLIFEFFQAITLVGLAMVLVLDAFDANMPEGSILLLAYWSLFLPILSRQLTEALRQIPSLHSVAQRALEVIDAPEESIDDDPDEWRTGGPAAIEFANLTVAVGELAINRNISVRIEPGEHVAIVGTSGSGKSTFLACVLGWHAPTAGTLLIDDDVARADTIARLREQTVVVDADLYLWNRSLFDNIRYGYPIDSAADLENALEASELIDDLERMDEGLGTIAGENANRLSGGEGQRLRIARGLIRRSPRLVLLDEPFAGMDSAQRARMRASVLERWRNTTLLFVSHNVGETAAFKRVLVFEDGEIVEDGDPRDLLQDTSSAYSRMTAAEAALDRHLQQGEAWVRLQTQAGEIVRS
jgi:ATP-binding cassette subfamily B protein